MNWDRKGVNIVDKRLLYIDQPSEVCTKTNLNEMAKATFVSTVIFPTKGV